jgi:hypothetical protein
MKALLRFLALAVLAFSAVKLFPDPAPTVDTSVPGNCPNLRLRGNLNNSRITFEKTGAGTVAFMGGSITEREGYRPLVGAFLQKKFPAMKFNFINAGIASTTSITGAFRLQDDVLSHGPIDLLFVEFAVNDDQDGHYTRTQCIRGMEGILRHVWQANPNTDVVVTYFVNGAMIASFNVKKTDPLSSASHEEVLEHYGISGVELNREVAARIAAGTLTFAQYGGVHPGPIGNQLGANLIDQLLANAWAAPLDAQAAVVPHVLPEPLDPNPYFNGRFIDVSRAQIVNGWTVGIPDWKAIGGDLRPHFANTKFICATTPGATLKLNFEGKAIGIYLLSGFDAGIVEASIDGAPAQRFDLFVGPAAALHYPCSIVFNDALAPGPHQLVLTITPDKNPKSKGTAARIIAFCAN